LALYLRHTFGTRLAATGQPTRAIQEFLGHTHVETTRIYMHDAPSERELAMVNEALAAAVDGVQNGVQTEENPGEPRTRRPC
jgi:integrase